MCLVVVVLCGYVVACDCKSICLHVYVFRLTVQHPSSALIGMCVLFSALPLFGVLPV